MFADGSNGSVRLDGDRLRINRKGFANILTQGVQGEKVIPLASISAVQFKSAGWMAGYIQFTIKGGIERPGGIMEATKDENAVLFEKKQQPAFEDLRKIVETAMSRPAASQGTRSSSESEELERLANLVERGFLTREEFEMKKRALLGI